METFLNRLLAPLVALPPAAQGLLVLASPALMLLLVLALNRWDEWRDRRRH